MLAWARQRGQLRRGCRRPAATTGPRRAVSNGNAGGPANGALISATERNTSGRTQRAPGRHRRAEIVARPPPPPSGSPSADEQPSRIAHEVEHAERAEVAVVVARPSPWSGRSRAGRGRSHDSRPRRAAASPCASCRRAPEIRAAAARRAGPASRSRLRARASCRPLMPSTKRERMPGGSTSAGSGVSWVIRGRRSVEKGGRSVSTPEPPGTCDVSEGSPSVGQENTTRRDPGSRGDAHSGCRLFVPRSLIQRTMQAPRSRHRQHRAHHRRNHRPRAGGGQAPAAPRGLCTDCGISRSADPKRCGRACQFIRPDYRRSKRGCTAAPAIRRAPDELHFGPFRRMLRAALVAPLRRRAMDRHRHPHRRATAGDRARSTRC